MPFVQRGLGIKSGHLGGTTIAEDVDDALGLARKVRFAGSHWAVSLHQSSKCQGPNTYSGPGKKFPAGQGGQRIMAVVMHVPCED